MSASVRIRDLVREMVPWWLSDRHHSSGKTVGFRIVWTLVASLDDYLDWLLAGLQASWPGVWNSSALPLIGRSRAILRGEADTNDEYVAKLRAWLEKHAQAGSMRQLAIELHEYLADHPRVRIINRGGRRVTVAADGSITTDDITWDWDSVSHPERASWWSDMWIIVDPDPWAYEGTWGSGGTWGDEGSELGFGHAAPPETVDAVKGLIAQWKAAHSRVRALIWTTDPDLFDPSDPDTMPDGEWGSWGSLVGGVVVPSHRNTTSCRYWEM